jgi:hypothetical protein
MFARSLLDVCESSRCLKKAAPKTFIILRQGQPTGIAHGPD